MIRRLTSIFLVILLTLAGAAGSLAQSNSREIKQARILTGSKPWTRWWWFASEIQEKDLRDNLLWLKNNGFGGVEIAWVYPLNRMKKDTVHYTPRQAWLSPGWTAMVSRAKFLTDSLGLGCDFTFGSLWPFGDIRVPFEEATRNMTDPGWRQVISASWDYPKRGYVIDHLSKIAFGHYANRMGAALLPAMKGSVSGLFCDSWEVETRFLTTPGFSEKFRQRYHYNLEDFRDSLYANKPPWPAVRYDYMKLLSEYVIEQFYKPFTAKSHELGGYSRVQCSGAPCDILSAYATPDVPESEALLYEPAFSNIVASAAALAGKPVVSSETFTCLYGWPSDYHSREQTADLKLLADALFANGVNQVIWHGKPLNPAGLDTVRFYASVHVGASGALAGQIREFNKYLETVSGYLKKGKTVSKVAVYLPNEDTWIAGELPVEKQFIWAWGAYEHRYTRLPSELTPYRPLWINGEFLEKAVYRNGLLTAGDLSFSALYTDVRFMDLASLEQITRLAEQGLPVCLKQVPAEPGYRPLGEPYKRLVERLVKLKNVRKSWEEMTGIEPLVHTSGKVDFWCRRAGTETTFFFAYPRSKSVTFPMVYGQSLNGKTDSIRARFRIRGREIPYTLVFKPYQSILLQISGDGNIKPVDAGFVPSTPVYIPREKKGKEKWEVGYQAK